MDTTAGHCHYYTFDYRECFLAMVTLYISDRRGEFRIESGVFVRKKRYIKFDRIHGIDISEGIIQRVFSLVKLNIETGRRVSGGCRIISHKEK